MKADRKINAEAGSTKAPAAKKVRGAAPKRTPKSNGKQPLATYEYAPIGIVECSPEGRYINVNEEFCRMLGYEKRELIGIGLKEITHEDDYLIDIKLHQQLIDGKLPFYRLEKRYIRKDGEILWVELTRSLVRDAPGNPLYTIGVVLDISERKHVERVLRDSSERLLLATEAARMFTWELDFRTQIYTLADNFEHVLGFSAGLLPKNSVETVYGLSPSEDMRTVVDISAKAIENHSDLKSLQFRVINPENGEAAWLEVNAKIVYDDEGKPKRMFGVAQNITERKRAEEALRQSEERFVQFMQHFPGLAWIKDMQGRYVYANAAAEEAFSTPRGKLYGKTDQDVFPPDVAAQFKKNDEQALLDEKGIQVVETLEHDDGVLHYSLVNKFPIPGPDGDIALIGGTAFDITERKQAGEALRESEARYRTLFESIDEGFCIIEKVKGEEGEKLDFLYIEANPAFAVQAGVGDVVGRTIRQVVPGESEEWFETYNNILRTGEPMKFERELVTQGRVLELYAFRVDDGTDRRVAVIFNDITARKQAEEALQQLNLQLESRVQIRTEKLNDAIRALREEIKERKQVEAALHESRKRLQILSQRLVEVQEEERRAIARELHDRVGQTLSALNINMIIMRDQLSPEAIERVGPRLEDSMHLVGETITLVRDVMSNLRPAVLDDYGLEAALQSHVDEFISRYGIRVVLERPAQPIRRLGSSIEMTFLRIAQEALMNIARHANASQVTLSLWQEADSIRMTVQDNGSGIESWQEANRPGSHGLTIMRERAEAFGGNLEVTSIPGKGTKVEVSIPFENDNQPQAQKEAR